MAGAHLRVGLLLAGGLGKPTAAYQHLLTVLDLEPTDEEAAAAREAIAELENNRRRELLN